MPWRNEVFKGIAGKMEETHAKDSINIQISSLGNRGLQSFN